jgi:hypothetical protein
MVIGTKRTSSFSTFYCQFPLQHVIITKSPCALHTDGEIWWVGSMAEQRDLLPSQRMVVRVWAICGPLNHPKVASSSIWTSKRSALHHRLQPPQTLNPNKLWMRSPPPNPNSNESPPHLSSLGNRVIHRVIRLTSFSTHSRLATTPHGAVIDARKSDLMARWVRFHD